ncbi:MAG: hypothetical protein ACYSYL_20815 [Planctomycetota bacterium]|jgi:hypothetical protein
MSTAIRLTSMLQDTNSAPVDMLGYCLTHTDFRTCTLGTCAADQVSRPRTERQSTRCASQYSGCWRAMSQVYTAFIPILHWPDPGDASALPSNRH